MAKTRTNQPVVELTEDVSKAIDMGELDTKLRIVLEDVALPAIGGSTSLTQSQLESLDWATLLTANASLEVHFNDDSIVYLDKCVVEESLITFSCSTGEDHFYCVFSTADSGASINAGSITHLQLGGGGTQLYKHEFQLYLPELAVTLNVVLVNFNDTTISSYSQLVSDYGFVSAYYGANSTYPSSRIISFVASYVTIITSDGGGTYQVNASGATIRVADVVTPL